MTSFNPYRVFKFVATSRLKGLSPRIAQFQSLSGFQVRCNSIAAHALASTFSSFNPYRVFKFVATAFTQALQKRATQCFNPYRVFKFVATSGGVARMMGAGMVSIPIGFSSSLQPWMFRWMWVCMPEFQSLSGFQVRCNISRRPADQAGLRGFNPYRVFKFVATANRYAALLDHYRFQSLSGFQVRCNLNTRNQLHANDLVSIPIGFSSSLQLGLCR